MPKVFPYHPEQDAPAGHDYEADPQWRKKPLTPSQLQVNDVRLETLRPDRGPMLEINERATSTLVPDTAAYTPSASFVRIADATSNPIEKQRFTNLEEEYGWMRHLRLQKYQQNAYDDGDSAKCRWIHCSSKFPEYLAGLLWALSDDLESVADSMRMLDAAIQRNTRFSKHGKYFAPFSQCLARQTDGSSKETYPLLVSVPFMDWTMQGPTPPLRFQVDRREGFLSSRSSAHILRSVLQHYYRLEDTRDREHSQVFAKHKPWNTNRELDLKVRQWYGHYPTGLNVDELWILAIDAEHIVTFSSNQTWKSRWPPLQLTSRISDVSFRGIRNAYFRSGEAKEYTAITHMMASLSGAVGMMHRNFWPDMVLCLTDRYAGRMGHLQYRLHRSPSTKLVMDLIACQEELYIVIQITEEQIEMIQDLQTTLDTGEATTEAEAPSPASRRRVSATYGDFDEYDSPRRLVTRRSTYRQLSTSVLSDPLAQLLDNLQRELADLRDLRDNTDRLVNRTIQLVNIRLEDHGKAILVFTVVTIVFLPLNFVSSFFGMNFSDIRDMDRTQWLFWAVAICVTVGVVTSSIVLAFSGGAIVEKMHMWRDSRREKTLSTTTVLRQIGANVGEHGFRVYGTDKDGSGGTSYQSDW
ncbi:hypothetical protein M409DRAFT_19800 [Zasmidium cellare ATCC 36951]|uniref:Uncharacterized protein n=1 Tax=Zasmidium cellare ATCC 36951 TaxID=1080233 RepID=A0A6A6CSE1_ZASCE|nr:uncharacterized protein M409DRAFT_19800 [Zasmidium cellare ATCC 36951]KAF2170197.1 hypothetical protein M409DRAFT_19800 [Zasmidium cellare ATCC 36951]